MNKRNICIGVNNAVERPSYFKHVNGKSIYGPSIPQAFTLNKLDIGELVYKLDDHGIVGCGKSIENMGYTLREKTDSQGSHRHISANVAGLRIGEQHKDSYGDTYIPVKLITDPSIQQTIERYLVEKKGACPTAVNF